MNAQRHFGANNPDEEGFDDEISNGSDDGAIEMAPSSQASSGKKYTEGHQVYPQPPVQMQAPSLFLPKSQIQK
jgi:hypothetical protein